MQAQFELASLRARVLAQLAGDAGIVLVAAPGPWADAAGIAKSLAESFAEAGHGALLIEAASGPTGLARHCGGQLQSLAHALESDPPQPGPGELQILGGTTSAAQLANPRLADWLRRARGLVVVLTADLDRAADTIVLSGVADTILLAVADGRSRRRQLAAAVDALAGGGCRPLGLIAAPARDHAG